MSLENRLKEILTSALIPEFLEIENESHKHRSGSSTSHFRLVIVTTAFEGLRLIARHRKINTLLAAELAHEIHALALHTFTPEEWSQRGESAARSPACNGG